ncbi:MAG: ABC transporter ATP-binding protein, partial [Acutalibacteraceae bacterium]|nr:ABC transporter ATP-binding protein [Acutalibacteraceae bacterium]
MNKKKTNDKETLFWIFRNCKKYLPAVAVITLFSIVVSLTFIVLAWLSKDVIDVATGSKDGSLGFYGVLLLITIAVQIILHICDMLLKTYANGKLTILIRNNLFTAISRRKYSDVHEYHSGDLLNRLTSDVETVQSAVVNIIPSVASMVAKIVGGLVALIMLDKRIALIILVFGFTVPAIGRFISQKYKDVHKDVQKTEGKARAFMQECFENIVVLKAFEGEAPFVRKLNSYMKENYRLKMKRTKYSIITHMSLYTFFTVGYYAVLLWGAGQIAGGAITYGTLMAFLQLFQQIKAPLQNVSGIIPQYYSALASAERLIEIEKGDKDKQADKQKLETVVKNFSGIELNNITFAY